MAMAGELGFEPRFSESESDVLPLNYSPKARPVAASGVPPKFLAAQPPLSFRCRVRATFKVFGAAFQALAGVHE